MDFEFQVQEYNGRFRVLKFYGQNDPRNEPMKGRFHRPEQAQAWIDQELAHTEQAYKNRKGHLHPELCQENFYEENERMCAEGHY